MGWSNLINSRPVCAIKLKFNFMLSASKEKVLHQKNKYDPEERRGGGSYRMHDTDMRLASQTAHKRKSNTLEHTAGANRKRYSGAMEL